ncbi:arylsulfatase J-like [Amphiura filiformis]|uniref:arylsulfatase J-like n=1 Tax=Amphiura filiformis TaxID=82378 RepID=UPI003B217D61
MIKFGGNNYPLRGGKHLYYEGGTKVIGFVNSPLLPSTVRGISYAGLMGAADWYYTLVEGIAGGKMNVNQTDGFNMWDAIRFGSSSQRTEYLYAVGGDCNWTPTLPFLNQNPQNVPLMYGTIRRGPWKLIIGEERQQKVLGKEDYLESPNGVSLFNIHDDPYEHENELMKHQDIFEDLLRRLKNHCKTHVQYLPVEEDENNDPRKRDGLFGPWL